MKYGIGEDEWYHFQEDPTRNAGWQGPEGGCTLASLSCLGVVSVPLALFLFVIGLAGLYSSDDGGLRAAMVFVGFGGAAAIALTLYRAISV
jgi:hypothetical protein